MKYLIAFLLFVTGLLFSQNVEYVHNFQQWEVEGYTPAKGKNIGIWPQNSSVEERFSYQQYVNFGISKMWTAEEDSPHWGHFAKKSKFFNITENMIFQIHKDNYETIIGNPEYSGIKYYYIDEPFENQYIEEDKSGNPFTFEEVENFIRRMPRNTYLVFSTYSAREDIIERYRKLFSLYPQKVMLAPMKYSVNLEFWKKCVEEYYPGTPVAFIWMHAGRTETFNEDNLSGAAELADEIFIYAIDTENNDLKEVLFKLWMTNWFEARKEVLYNYKYKWSGESLPEKFDINNKNWKLVSKTNLATRAVTRSDFKFSEVPFNN